MQELQDPCVGTSERPQRNKSARADITKIFYKNENNSTFEKYVIKIKGVFNVMEKYNILICEEHIVNHLLEQIM